MCVFAVLPALEAAPRDVSFSQPVASIDAYDFVEVTVNVASPDAGNPFLDVSLKGSFAKAGGTQTEVEGFCDSPDGSVFRIRFSDAFARLHEALWDELKDEVTRGTDV